MKADRQRYNVSTQAMTVHLVEDRRAEVSPWGLGNSKIGPHVFTYSKLPGREESCVGATDHCLEYCYVQRMLSNPWLRALYELNSARGWKIPMLPVGAELVRGHISGDFDTPEYIEAWRELALLNPHCLFWFYTKSWRVVELLPFLEELRAVSNVQMLASMDPDCGAPPAGWRRAWLDSDPRASGLGIYCPEETGHRANCEECGYCFRKTQGDVTFIESRGSAVTEPKQ